MQEGSAGRYTKKREAACWPTLECGGGPDVTWPRSSLGSRSLQRSEFERFNDERDGLPQFRTQRPLRPQARTLGARRPERPSIGR